MSLPAHRLIREIALVCIGCIAEICRSDADEPEGGAIAGGLQELT